MSAHSQVATGPTFSFVTKKAESWSEISGSEMPAKSGEKITFTAIVEQPSQGDEREFVEICNQFAPVRISGPQLMSLIATYKYLAAPRVLASS
jgi:hypothetical protein